MDPNIHFPEDHQLREDLTVEDIYQAAKDGQAFCEKMAEKEKENHIWWSYWSVLDALIFYLEGLKDDLCPGTGLNEKGEKIFFEEFTRLAEKAKADLRQKIKGA